MKNKNLKVKVVGIGHGAQSIVENLYQNNKRENIEFMVIHSSKSEKNSTIIEKQYCLTEELESAMECFGNHEVIRKYAIDQIQDIRRFMAGSDIIILLSCFGGATGTGITPVIAKMLKDYGTTTFSIITLPFNFEGEHSNQLAVAGSGELARYQKDIIVIDSQAVLESNDFPEQASLNDAYIYMNKKVTEKFYTLLADVFDKADAG